MTRPFAEIIESSLTVWTAQTWQWDFFPRYGSLVSVNSGGRTILALVYAIKTGSMDPMRYPFPYQKTEEELREEQPQIFEFLKTTFSCLTIGYLENNVIWYQIAPQPPKIHAFVQYAEKSLCQRFFSDEHFMHILFQEAQQVSMVDELLLAILKELHHHDIITGDMLGTWMETFSLLSGNDYRRIKLFLQRAQTCLG